jgi:hypothetical protein
MVGPGQHRNVIMTYHSAIGTHFQLLAGERVPCSFAYPRFESERYLRASPPKTYFELAKLGGIDTRSKPIRSNAARTVRISIRLTGLARRVPATGGIGCNGH